MNKCFLKLSVLFIASTGSFLLSGCTKDLSDLVAGEYTGTTDTYFFGTRPSQVQDARIIISKLGETTISMEFAGAAFPAGGSSEVQVKYDGTFGNGFHTPRGTVFILGSEGRFINDSLYYSFASFDSIGNYSLLFRGRKK